MHFVGARARQHFADIARVDFAAGHHLESPPRRRDRPPDVVGTIHGSRPLPRGQHAVDAAARQRLHGLVYVARHIEGTMAGHGHFVSRNNQR
jgi:hypothetical protein